MGRKANLGTFPSSHTVMSLRYINLKEDIHRETKTWRSVRKASKKAWKYSGGRNRRQQTFQGKDSCQQDWSECSKWWFIFHASHKQKRSFLCPALPLARSQAGGRMGWGSPCPLSNGCPFPDTTNECRMLERPIQTLYQEYIKKWHNPRSLHL